MSLAPKFIVAALASALTLVLPSTASAVSARPATLDSVFASATGGETIELAAGDYGTFEGSRKSGVVTLAPQPGAAVRMELDFDPASNITLDGITISDAYLGGGTKNITVRNSDIPGQVVFRTDELADANILFERNVHRDWDKCDDCGEGRVWLPGDSSQPTGITIRSSEFKGGLSDGIQNGSNGTKILNNTFHDLELGSPEGVHSDAIQLYGSQNTVIRGNYFYDLNVPAIMSPDGADHEIIEDNVIHGDSDGYPYAITLFSDDGSIIRHNTFADGDCAFNLPCGILRIGAKSGDPEGHGTVVEDNILSQISVEAGTLARRSHNLIAHDQASGTAEIAGRPTYVGGPSPTTYIGYVLARGSRGKGNASDGLDRGARLDVSACLLAEAKVEKAKANVKRAKHRLADATGHKQTKKAKKKLRKAKKKLRKAKKKLRDAC